MNMRTAKLIVFSLALIPNLNNAQSNYDKITMLRMENLLYVTIALSDIEKKVKSLDIKNLTNYESELKKLILASNTIKNHVAKEITTNSTSRNYLDERNDFIEKYNQIFPNTLSNAPAPVINPTIQ